MSNERDATCRSGECPADFICHTQAKVNTSHFIFGPGELTLLRSVYRRRWIFFGPYIVVYRYLYRPAKKDKCCNG